MFRVFDHRTGQMHYKNIQGVAALLKTEGNDPRTLGEIHEALMKKPEFYTIEVTAKVIAGISKTAALKNPLWEKQLIDGKEFIIRSQRPDEVEKESKENA